MSAAQSTVSYARLLEATSRYSRDFLSAVPCTSVGSRRSASPAIYVSKCQFVHLISVSQSEVRTVMNRAGNIQRSAECHIRHTAISDLVKRTMTSAEIPAHLEPASPTWKDGKRLDAMVIQQVLGVGFQMSRHSRTKPTKECSRQSCCCC